MTELFLRPYAVIFLILVAPFVFGWAHRQITIRHSSLKPQKGLRTYSLLVMAASVCLALMTTNLTIALMGPKVPDAKVEHIAVIRKVCLFIDRSGSMTAVLTEGAKELSEDEAAAKAKNGGTVGGDGNDKLSLHTGDGEDTEGKADKDLTRIDAAQLAARYIIRNRMTDNPNETDQFCIWTFDTDSYNLAPLSNDKNALLRRATHITENVGGGTNFAGPYGYISGIGPLQKASDFFAKYATPDSVSVVILITDGEDGFPEERKNQLLQLFKQQKLRFYVIGLGDGWKEGNNLDLQKFADAIHKDDPTNGLVFRASNPGAMRAAMETINKLEKAQEVVLDQQEYKEIFQYFLYAAAAFGALFVLLALAARRVP